MKKGLLLPVSLLALSVSTAVNADVRINGFANFTAGYTTEDTGLYGYEDKVDFSNGSLFAIQISGSVNENVTATAQLLARGNEDYNAEFEWAYLTYAIDDSSSISGGRLRLPLFRYSSSLDVGYSYHWITAPRSVYSVPFNNYNGLRYDLNGYKGDLEYNVSLFGGEYSNEVSGGDLEADKVFGITTEFTYNSFKARFVAGRGSNTLSIDAVDGTLAQLSPIAPELADDLAMIDDSGLFLGAGFEFDNFDWFVSAEYTSVETKDSFSPKDIAWYVTAGKRIGSWTPHITYEARDGDHDFKFLDQVAAFPEQFQPALLQATAGLQSFFMEDFSMLTVGLRYDWSTNIAIKGEVSRYDNKRDDNPADINPAEDTTLLNVSVNYVF
ncbi:porin [Glaciecola siphonariae]|uniref:Porin n=1 Tax=Glaciecola siphonariae TaxID=521012 RepID=A0ABV9LQW4_9ALTE